MNGTDLPESLRRVLVLVGTARDSQLICELLQQHAIPTCACRDAQQLHREIAAGAGTVLIAEECLDQGGHDALLQALARQPAWSDLPILVLARTGADSVTVGDAIASLGNVTLLERPLRVAALVSVVRTALRARFRQYQIEANLKSLEAARDAEAWAARRKDEFLAMLAHELRNPLAPIRTALYLIEQQDIGADKRGQLQRMMERQVDHLVRLVDDLLESSRLSRGKIELKRECMDLKDALLRAVELSRPQIDEAGCVLEMKLPPEPLEIDADAIRMAQVFANLLNNAARYGRSGGRIRLEASPTNDGQALIRVIDDGIGIDPETLPHVFELFSQGKREERAAQGGLGIGLALVRSLVEQHGGRVVAASQGCGKGAEFSVWLPLNASRHQAATQPPTAPPALPKGLHVLVVDDNQDAANALGMLLAASGVEHRVAHDGPGALSAANELMPDAILLDIGMPGMDGYAVARALRADPRHNQALIIALTGWSETQDLEASKSAGFDHHLRKPADIDELLRLLAKGRHTLAPPGLPAKLAG